MKISEILHLAADEFLSPSEFSDWFANKVVFSCDAIYCAVNHDHAILKNIKIGLRRMGLNTGSIDAFDEFEEGSDRQYARYVWLKFAAKVAEEQGV